MSIKSRLYFGVATIALAALLAAPPTRLSAQQSTPPGVTVGATDIGGAVRSASGPEAGVWVIAETTDLPTKFAKMRRHRRSGPLRHPRSAARQLQGLGARLWAGRFAEDARQAGPASQSHGGAGAERGGGRALLSGDLLVLDDEDSAGQAISAARTDIPENITQANWLKQMNNIDCIGCHQLGQESTRTIPAQFGKFKSGEEAWMRRIQSGQSGEMMTNQLAGQFGGAPFKYFGDWTDRVAKGELPKAKPPRPQGVERNIVVTSWEWSTPTSTICTT